MLASMVEGERYKNKQKTDKITEQDTEIQRLNNLLAELHPLDEENNALDSTNQKLAAEVTKLGE